MEDIFEESDTFPAEPSEQDVVSAKYFDCLHPSTTFPLLSSKAVGKISTSVNRVQKAIKKSRSQEMDWEAAGLPKLLRLLERSMTGLDALTPFENDKKATVAKKKVKTKKDKEKKGSKSPEVEAADLREEEGTATAAELTTEEIQQKEAVIEAYARAGLAAECCLTLLDTDGMPKHVSRQACCGRASSRVAALGGDTHIGCGLC
jgi:cohesin loading factor subunit SCC2